MTPTLEPCPLCSRHIGVSEVRCPFCDSARIESVETRTRTSRGMALLVTTAFAAAGCAQSVGPYDPDAANDAGVARRDVPPSCDERSAAVYGSPPPPSNCR